MKLRKTCFLIFIGLFGCFYFGSQIGNSSKVPVSYQECMNSSKKYSFDGSKRNDLVCDFVVKGLWAIFLSDNDVKLLKQCQEMNGAQCAQGRCCMLNFYNPDYSFPHNFQECIEKNKKYSDEYNSCTVGVGSFAYNHEVANQLINQCGKMALQYQDKESSDAVFGNSMCSITFYR